MFVYSSFLLFLLHFLTSTLLLYDASRKTLSCCFCVTPSKKSRFYFPTTFPVCLIFCWCQSLSLQQTLITFLFKSGQSLFRVPYFGTLCNNVGWYNKGYATQCPIPWCIMSCRGSALPCLGIAPHSRHSEKVRLLEALNALPCLAVPRLASLVCLAVPWHCSSFKEFRESEAIGGFV